MVPGSSYLLGISILHIKDNFSNQKRGWVWQHDHARVQLEACGGPIAQGGSLQRESE